MLQHNAEHDAALHYDDVAAGTFHWNAYRKATLLEFEVCLHLGCSVRGLFDMRAWYWRNIHALHLQKLHLLVRCCSVWPG